MSGKKNKGSFVAGKESFQRINYLYQLGTLMSEQQNTTLSAYYGRMCKLIGQKSVLRLEPEIKRKICKACKVILVPGTTAEIQVVGRRKQKCEIKCKNCNSRKIFHLDPDYHMWLDNPQSIVETITTAAPVQPTCSGSTTAPVEKPVPTT